MTRVIAVLVSLIGVIAAALAAMVKIPDLKILALVLAIGLILAGIRLFAAGKRRNA